MTNTPHDHNESAATGSSWPDDPDAVIRESGKTTSERRRQGGPRESGDDDEPADCLADDVLLGAKRIAEHLTAIFGTPVTEADVYYAVRMRKWPIGKYGALLIASKRRFASHVEKITRGPAAVA